MKSVGYRIYKMANGDSRRRRRRRRVGEDNSVGYRIYKMANGDGRRRRRRRRVGEENRPVCGFLSAEPASAFSMGRPILPVN